jgi:molybdate transport system permease protein
VKLDARALPGVALGAGLLVFLLLPIIALALSGSPREILDALRDPIVPAALELSAWTSAVSLAVVVVTGTPLAWFLARGRAPWLRAVESLVELPIVIPPAVVGIALLLAFGRRGLLGPLLDALDIGIPFTPIAVVMAQTIVAAPFYIRSATAGFRTVDDDLLLVARTLGASPTRAFLRVAVPLALPGITSGMALCWARAIGEFGATLLFAGNYPGRTQTMPLAIYATLESDVQVATAIALVLALVAFATLLATRVLDRVLRTRAEGSA